MKLFRSVSSPISARLARFVPAVGMVLACLGLFAGPVCEAQTAHFSGAIQTLGSGFGGPAGVAVDASGNVFVADYGDSEVKEIVAVGGYTTVNALGSGFNTPFGVAVDGSGNVFVADTYHSAAKEIVAGTGGAPAGTVNTSSTVNTLGSGFSYPQGVAVDGNGNVFVADSSHNEVKEIVAGTGGAPAGTVNSNSTVNTLGSGFSVPLGVAVDGNDNLFVADYGHSAVKEIVAAGGYTTVNILGSGFQGPYGVAVDGNDNVFVADTAHSAVQEIVAAGGYTTVNTLGSGFSYPNGVAVDASGNVFVADTGNAAVKEIVAAGGNFGPVNVGSASANPITLVFTFDTGGTLGSIAVLTQGAPNLDFTDAGTGTCTTNGTAHTYSVGDTCTVNVTFKPKAPGLRMGAAELLNASGNLLATGYVQGTGVGPLADFAVDASGNYAPSAQTTLGSGFSLPSGVAVDASGNVFVADSNHNAVKEIVAPGYTMVNTLAVVNGNFNWPSGVAVDGGGNVFVADKSNSVVKEIVAAGGYTTVKTLGSGSFFAVSGVAVDGSGNVFVADTGQNAVKEIVAADGYTTVNTLAVANGNFNTLTGVAVDGSGNVFVADANNNAVKEIVAAGGYTTVNTLAAGNGNFNWPFGVAVDGSGNVFVADSRDNAVKEIVAAGGYTTVNTLGSGFNQPFGVAVDGSGNVFVADYGNSTVKKLDYADPPSLSFATTSVGSESSDSPRSVTVLNNGNAALTFPIPDSGDNPSIAGGFSLDSATTCPQLTPSSSPAGTLAADASCTYAVDFIPAAAGTNSGPAALTDDNLNVAGAQQSISLSGTGVLIAVSPATLPAGTVATAYSQMLSASGGTAVYIFSVTSGSLPAGLNLSSAGVLSGTPTAAGTFNFTVTATDSSTGAGPYTGSAGYSIVVNKATATVSAWPAASAITYGQTLANSTLSGGTASTAGTFAFTAPSIAPGAGAPSESVTFTPGDTADYNSPANGSVYVTVNKAMATATLGGLGQTYTGSPLSATATTVPTGLAVDLTYNGSPTAPTAAGSYIVVGTINNANYTGTATGTLVIGKAAAGITVTPYSVTYDGNAYTATGTATGVGGVNLNSDLTLSGTAHTAAGTYATDAWSFHDPNGNYADANGTVNDAIARAALMVTANNATKAYGTANPIFTGTLTGQQGSDTFTESFSTTATPASNVGSYAIMPSVTGTDLADYTQSVTNGTLSVTQAASMTALSVSSGSITPGQNVTLTAQVTSATTGAPTGVVNFYDNNALLNAAQLKGGTATCLTAALAAGITHTITAIYEGDTNFTPSSSTAATTVIVAPLDFTMNIAGPSSQTVVPGSIITYQVTVTPMYGSYAGTVSFAVSGLPAGSTATFSPSSIAANGGPQTITITIKTVPVTATQKAPPQPFGGRRLAPLALAILFLFGAGGIRRRGQHLRRMLCVALLAAGGLAAIALSGCAGGFFTQQPQNYAITLTATAGNLQHTATFMLNVQ